MDIQQVMLDNFRASSEQEQKEGAMLAGNARFLLRMTEGFDTNTEIGKAVKSFRNALIKGIPSLGGEDV